MNRKIPLFQASIFQIAVLAFITLAALSRIWVAEDAYITFRAVDNLYRGHGLVYNPGERVEVFTHPLWMFALMILQGNGVPLHAGSILLGLLFTLGSLYYLVYRKRSDGSTAFPFAPLLLAGISGFRDFATAGMEFSLVFFLLTLFYTELERHRLRDKPFFFGGLLALLYLTRPELALLPVYYSFHLLFELVTNPPLGEWESHPARNFPGYGAGEMEAETGKRTRKPIEILALWTLPILLYAGGYHLFRYLYYGDLFPNTYYAKAGLSTYYSQGFKYLAYTLAWAPGLWILGLLALGMAFYRPIRRLFSSYEHLANLRDLGAATLLAFYVIRVGGDFMAFRFLLPEIAIYALVVQRIFQKEGFSFRTILPGKIPLLLSTTGRTRPWIFPWFAFLFFALLLLWPVPLSRGYVADERRFFTDDVKGDYVSLFLGSTYRWGRFGKDFRFLQKCLDYDPFWISNSQYQAQCMKGVGLGYFGMKAGPAVKILDEQGLPNPEVANQSVLVRFRPGHEHYLSLTDVIDKGVLFCSTGEPGYDRAMTTRAGIVIRLDPDLLSTIPGIRSRLENLVQLKREGSAIIPRLEKRYHTTVEQLLAESSKWEKDPLQTSKHSCWDEFPEGTDRYFY